MSIASEISRLQSAKAAIKTAIENKGVTIPSNATLDSFNDYIAEIPSSAAPAVSHSDPSISINSNTGVVTATHTQESGTVTGGTTTDTMQLTTQAAQTITPTTIDQTITAGKYLTGAQTIKGDANLVAANIVEGVSIFGVNGTASGGGTSVAPNDVNFRDYDGTIVASYSASDFANLSALPTNPSHDGLTAQGWNWSLSDAKTYVASYGKLEVGQMYITSDGKTRLYITLREPDLSMRLNFQATVDGGVTIDWGDNSTTTTSSGTAESTYDHEYSVVGDYVITLTVSSGELILGFLSTAKIGNITGDNDKNWTKIIRVHIGASVQLLNAAFKYCYYLTMVTLPNYLTSIGSGMFQTTKIVQCTIPNLVTRINDYTFHNCRNLVSISIPTSVSRIDDYSIDGCVALSTIICPDNCTYLGNYVFMGNYNVSYIHLPNSITNLGTQVLRDNPYLTSVTIPNSVTTLGNQVFYGCYGLSTIRIPSNVISIGTVMCSGSVVALYFEPTTPPTIMSTTFQYLTNAIIYVPSASVDTYKAANYWSNYADKIQAMP